MAHDHDHDHEGFDVQVERTGPCIATVRFTVSAAEHQKARRRGMKNYARQTRMKGFRPGKVPPHMIEKQYGSEIDRAVIEHFVQHAFEHAVKNNELRPAATPQVDMESIEASKDADWSHEFEVLLRPEVKLGEIEGLSIESGAIEVGDEELEATLANIRREMSVPEPAGEAGLPIDGMAVCKLAFLREGVDEPVLERDGIRLNPKSAPKGIDEEKFEEEMTGAKEGESRTFEFEFPDDFPDEESRGSKGKCRIELTEAFKIVPPEDARVFAEFKVEDEAGLNEAIRGRILDSKRDQENQRIETALLAQLMERNPMELPGPLVADQVEHRVEQLRQELGSQGLEGAELDERLDAERASAAESAERGLRAVYLIEEIARQKSLQVGEQDFEAEFAAIAVRNGVEPDQVRKYYQEEKLLQQLGIELLERKVRGFLRESADIKLVGSPD